MKNCFTALLTIMVAACSSTTPQQQKPPEVSLLYVQTATSGTFEPIAGSNNKYRLVLSGVSPSVVYFSDRPNRLAGHISEEAFLKGIGFGGKLDPNAAIDIQGGAADSDLIVVKLDKPAYDASSGMLSYEISILETAREGLQMFSRRMDKQIPAHFGSVAVFIDSAPCQNRACGSGVFGMTQYGDPGCCPGTHCVATSFLGVPTYYCTAN